MTLRSPRDQADYTEFVSARSAALFRTAYLMVGDHQLAQDLLQESLIKTYVAWAGIRDLGRAEAYARRTIVTTAISWRRRRSFFERPVETVSQGAVNDQVDALLTHEALSTQLHSLPPRQRAAIVLRFYEDLTEHQTAKVMGCSVGTVKSQVSAGLARLRQSIGPDLVPFSLDQEAKIR